MSKTSEQKWNWAQNTVFITLKHTFILLKWLSALVLRRENSPSFYWKKIEKQTIISADCCNIMKDFFSLEKNAL